MGELLEQVKYNNFKNGLSIADNYKNNTKWFYDQYKKSSKEVLSVQLDSLHSGGFYFLHYLDDSNWMKYSPIFAVDTKKFDKNIILNAINFNFIPLEIRVAIFDKYITINNLDKNKLLSVDYVSIYNILKKYGFEYSLVEYNMTQIKLAHEIDMSLVPKFLYSGYPSNTYDSKKLYSICVKKLETADKRNQEMMTAIIKDFYNISNDINENYNMLKSHIQRVQTSYAKYGNK